MRAGVEPSGAATEQLDVEAAGVEVEPVEIRDLKLAALGGLEGARAADDVGVVEIDAGDGVVGFRLRGLFLEREHAAIGRELDDTVALRVGDMVAKDRGAAGAFAGALERAHEVVAVEKIVAEDERGGLVFQEARVAGDMEGLRETIGAGLLGVGKFQAQVGAVTEELLEEREIGRRGDDEDLADAGEHEDRQRVIDHRLVVDGHELLAHRDRQREETRAGAAREDDAFAIHVR